MRRPIICATIFAPLLALAFGSAVHAAICRVNPTGTGDGTNWTTQAAGLQSALTNASCTEIWVAKGVYKPGASQDDSFNIRPGVAVYGGFAGTETTRDARDFAANVTILSGDIDGDDTNTDGNFIAETSADIQGGNTQHIVVMDGTTAAGNITATTVFDGFTLTGGNNTSNDEGGGALLCKGNGAGHACSPTLSHLVFSGNKAQYGGAMFNNGYSGGASSPTLTNATFSGNSAIDGGAMYNYGFDGASSPSLSNVTFSGNSATNQGGAMYNDGTNGGASSPNLTDVTFSGNNANLYGGAMYNDGFNGGSSSPTLTNATFSGNNANLYGGAMANDGYYGASNPTLTNVTFSGNSAFDGGGAMFNYGVGGTSSPTLTNVILWGDTAGEGPEIFNASATMQIDHVILAANGCVANGTGACPSSGFVSADPLLGALADNGGATRTMLPGAGSSAIDAGLCAGDNPAVSATDQRGVARPQGAGCDIGAVEVRSSGGICYVNASATGMNNGTSWADAYFDLQNALTDPACTTDVWVAKGVYKPGASQDDSFNIHPGVAVYGGFAGTETTRDARDFAANVTILSGDIDGDDTNTDGNFIDETSADIQGGNTQHIVVMDGTTAAGKITATTVLDGFTLTGGSAFDSGGALFCDGHAANHECSPTLTNVTFSGNSAIDRGGAMVNNGSSGGISSPTLSNVTFSGNSAGVGGAMYNFGQGGGNSSPELTNVTFSGNNASFYGGAMFNDGLGGTSSPTLSNVTFSGNSATNQGGAMFNDGRIGGTSSPTLTNVTFSGNSANYGGAIVHYGVDGSNNLTLINVILWGDTAGTGPEIYNRYATVQIDYSIVSANGCVASGIGSTCPSSGFVSADPKLGALADNGGSTRTMLPGAGSAAIDAGTCSGAPATDQRGVARPQGAGCDIGAVEVREAQLSVSATAGGSVSAGASPAANGAAIAVCTSSGGTCSAYYSIPPDVATAPVVSLSAAPDAGYHLSSWGGDCASAGSSLSATVTMDQARTCSAAFAVNTTVTTLASDINPSSFGQSVTFTATVAPVAPASADPTGTVSFTDGGNAIGCDSQPLSATAPFTATCTIATLAVGNHSIIAQYGGDTNYLSPQPASNTLAQGVDTMAQVIAFTSSAPTAGVGGSYTVSATGGGSGNPVIFSIDPASTPGACTIAGSTVTFTGAGTCIIDADQAGDAHYAPAPQAQQTITVAAVPTPTPMLDRWALLLLGGFIGMLGFVRMREA